MCRLPVTSSAAKSKETGGRGDQGKEKSDKFIESHGVECTLYMYVHVYKCVYTCTNICTCIRVHIQWNFSNLDTVGREESVLISEVS